MLAHLLPFPSPVEVSGVCPTYVHLHITQHRLLFSKREGREREEERERERERWVGGREGGREGERGRKREGEREGGGREVRMERERERVDIRLTNPHIHHTPNTHTNSEPNPATSFQIVSPIHFPTCTSSPPIPHRSSYDNQQGKSGRTETENNYSLY